LWWFGWLFDIARLGGGFRAKGVKLNRYSSALGASLQMAIGGDIKRWWAVGYVVVAVVWVAV
jgi:hypothetical protein